MHKRGKWISNFNLALLIAFAIVIALNYWTAIEKVKLNQRYELLIEQREEINKEMNLLIKRFQGLADRS